MWIVQINSRCGWKAPPSPPPRSPDSGVPPGPLQGVGVADQLVQHVDDLPELGPVGPLSLPAVQHELVQHDRTVHGSWEPEVLLDGIYHLGHSERGQRGRQTQDYKSRLVIGNCSWLQERLLQKDLEKNKIRIDILLRLIGKMHGADLGC